MTCRPFPEGARRSRPGLGSGRPQVGTTLALGYPTVAVAVPSTDEEVGSAVPSGSRCLDVGIDRAQHDVAEVDGLIFYTYMPRFRRGVVPAVSIQMLTS